MADDREFANSISIGEGVKAKGTFHVPGSATINGTLEGELVAKNLVVGPTGSASGKFKVESAEIRGRVLDTLVATQTLVIRATGKVQGNIVYRDVEIEKGGEVEGKMSQYVEGAAIPAIEPDRSAPRTAAPATPPKA